jgi:translation initiation factor IF-1
VRRALLGPEKLKVTIKNEVNKLNGIEGKIRILNIL